MKDNIVFHARGKVSIRKLENDTSKVLIESIHGKINFGRKLFCNGFIPLTLKKLVLILLKQQLQSQIQQFPPLSPNISRRILSSLFSAIMLDCCCSLALCPIHEYLDQLQTLLFQAPDHLSHPLQLVPETCRNYLCSTPYSTHILHS